jgi:feruloyl esterase
MAGIVRGLALGGVAMAAMWMMPAAAQAAGGAADCTALARSPAGPGVTVSSSRWIAAAAGLPAFCEVQAMLNPASNSNIGVVYRLPESWNGKILGIGGGGWAGNVSIQAAADGLKRGYATAQTDGGHPSTNLWDNSWASNPAAVTDFAYRAIHLMTVTGKAMVATYYRRPHAYAYYQGCSTGGRMGLMEAQRFPDDYDGIIAGAPVYTLQVQTSSILRNQAFGAPGAAFSEAQLKLVNDASVKACDAADGLKDGLIGDPRSCTWKPATLLCKPGQKAGATCLSAPQVRALNTAYDGVKAPNGSWAAFPMSRGGEAGWSRFVRTGNAPDATGGGGMVGLKPLLFGNRAIDITKMTPRDVTLARSTPFAREYEAADPDLRAFVAGGGKLILWHGENDPGPSPVGTADYYRAVSARVPQADQSVRLFMAPGVEHCRGGPGADMLETIGALERWVEQGQAPETIVATRADGSLTRSLCPFPKQAHYSGAGDPNQPTSWSCR